MLQLNVKAANYFNGLAINLNIIIANLSAVVSSHLSLFYVSESIWVSHV